MQSLCFWRIKLFCRKIGLLRFSCFCVGKILAKNSVRGEMWQISGMKTHMPIMQYRCKQYLRDKKLYKQANAKTQTQKQTDSKVLQFSRFWKQKPFPHYFEWVSAAISLPGNGLIFMSWKTNKREHSLENKTKYFRQLLHLFMH